MYTQEPEPIKCDANATSKNEQIDASSEIERCSSQNVTFDEISHVRSDNITSHPAVSAVPWLPWRRMCEFNSIS